ncbi:MAG: hypothetical protein GXO75_15385 [Calditrichaeota bacterium]|nr:hypothetical protein [Calditrichota bacterium]
MKTKNVNIIKNIFTPILMDIYKRDILVNLKSPAMLSLHVPGFLRGGEAAPSYGY